MNTRCNKCNKELAFGSQCLCSRANLFAKTFMIKRTPTTIRHLRMECADTRIKITCPKCSHTWRTRQRGYICCSKCKNHFDLEIKE